MDLLLLVTYTLLSSYLLCGRVVEAQRPFAIRTIVLSIEPSAHVSRASRVTVRCKAVISTSDDQALSREYTIYKDNDVVSTNTSSTSEDFLYQLPEARVSDTGNYRCKISIMGKEMSSEPEKLTVTGLSKPVLHLNNGVVTEGDEVTARCTAPGEKGRIYFYLYKDSKVISENGSNSNQSETKIRFSGKGLHKIHCTYAVIVTPDSFKSEESNTVTVTVKELSITPVMQISPSSNIYEGDHLNILCTIVNLQHSSKNINFYLSQGTKLLSSGVTEVNHSMIALADDPQDFECRLEFGNVEKVATKTVLVTELFSAPNLTMYPAEVFQEDYMTITCKSEKFASERLNREELIYSLHQPESHFTQKTTGVFYGRAPRHDFNYTCVARARGISKHSEILTIRPKVSVSTPNISVDGTAVLGQSFKILCQSDTGSLPITYTLLSGSNQLSTITVRLPSQKALFTVTINKLDEISSYRCKAINSHRDALFSKTLNATVIEPLTHPTITVIPPLAEISEGDHLVLICRVNGTPPVNFKWYRNNQPLKSTVSNHINVSYEVSNLSKVHRGKYYCEAVNQANNVVQSEEIPIEVQLARWKKAVIGGFCVLLLLMLLVGCVLYFKSKRGRREAAAELSVKPSSPKPDDSLTVTLTHNTEVYNTATVKVDRAAVSVWSERPPEAANDEISSVVSSEPDVEYTEVVHSQPADSARVPLRKGTDTVYSELKSSPHGTADHHDYQGSVEYAELNDEQPESNHYSPEVSNYLPVPVD